MNKTICLITSEESFLNNYGAALQGFALYKTLESFDFNVKILRYKGGAQNPSSFLLFQRIIKTLQGCSVAQNVAKINLRIYGFKFRKEIQKRDAKFLKFSSQMNYFPGERISWNQLKHNNPEADIYVCGSDQIWNPMFKNGENDLGYFLYFVQKGKRMIAYAPSLGVNIFPETAKANLPELLNRFDYISVREITGSNIIKKETGLSVPVVVDPVFLLQKESWLKIVNPSGIKKDFILCYLFTNDFDNFGFMDYVKAELNLPIISIQLSGLSLSNHSYEKFFDVGPSEFVDLVANAKFVCTDSFHATAFSIIMKTPFISFLKKNKIHNELNMNSRITDLLRDCFLSDRIITEMDQLKNINLLKTNFEQSEIILKEKREQSLAWLNNALFNEKQYH